MQSFSERNGFVKVSNELKIGYIDVRLKNRLWNVIDVHILQEISEHPEDDLFCLRLYDVFLGVPINKLPQYSSVFCSKFEIIWSEMKWNKVFDFLEFCMNSKVGHYNYGPKAIGSRFAQSCNLVLETERSGYRIVDGIVAQITNDQELEEIEAAANSAGESHAISTHMKAALRHYANREKPDFRNSVKESISAVEAAAKWITEDPKASLGSLLAILEKQYGLHKALKQGFSSLYGWTSQDGGARHALLDRETITEAEARYMLVSCSAFCNYLINLKAHGPRAEA